MERKDYQIRTNDGTRTVRGYVFRVGAHKYGVARDCVRGAWIITELSSGCSVYPFGDYTREKAIENLPHYIVCINDFNGVLRRVIESRGELNEEIDPKTEVLYPITAWR